MPAKATLTLVERVFSRIDKDGPLPEHRPELGPCWLWTGARTKDGYGELKVRGVVVYVHRLAWRIAHGRSAPIDRMVLHHCDRPACARPSHLFVGTAGDNNRDAAAKGRNWSRRDERGRYAKAAA